MRRLIPVAMSRIRLFGASIALLAIAYSTSLRVDAAADQAAVAHQTAKVTAGDLGSKHFGDAIAISGDTIAVSAPLHSQWAGATYVFVRNELEWVQQAKLVASDANANDLFGTPAISLDTVVVGASWTDHSGGDQVGSSYVFVRNGTTWSQQAKLKASDAATGDRFGRSVAVSGDTVFVGAPFKRGEGWPGSPNVGAAYFYLRNGTAWSQQAKVVATYENNGYSEFGGAVALDEDTAVVGAAGISPFAAYVFVRFGTTWYQEAKLMPNDANGIQDFGSSVSISGDTLVVGAPGDNTGASGSGSAYVFVRDKGYWTQQAKLLPGLPLQSGSFGRDVDIAGDVVVVGTSAPQGTGAAYVFVRQGTLWTQSARLEPGDFATSSFFGYGVAIDGDLAAVGAPQDDWGPGAGSVYVFDCIVSHDCDDDGLLNFEDVCPYSIENDTDGDGVCQNVDNCPAVENPSQLDLDGDDVGDACDPCTDSDGDGYGQPGAPNLSCELDNCPQNANAGQADADADGLGDACDNCALDASASQRDGEGFGDPNDGQQLITQLANGAQSVHLADLDGDGDLDALSASGLDHRIAWYENLGAGSFGPQRVISTLANGASSVCAADLDGDGDNDVVSTSVNDDEIAWYRNLGGGQFSPQIIISKQANAPTSAYATDFDGDGRVDLLSVSQFDSRIAWFRNLTGGNFGGLRQIDDPNGGVTSAHAADVDGDGDVDALSSSIGGNIAWHENLGGGIFGPRLLISTLANGASSVYSADLDGDGDLDVLSAARFDDQIAWYENLGGGSFGEERVVSTLTNGASAVRADDIDGDGDFDILSASQDDDKVAWYENLGEGSFGAQRVISNLADSVRSIAHGDLDGDGDPEVLSASFNNDEIALYSNLGDGVGDVCDLCPAVPDVRQQDIDEDGVGDACDTCPDDPANDSDADGFCANEDNCPTGSNQGQANADNDRFGDDCDCAPDNEHAWSSPGPARQVTLSRDSNARVTTVAWLGPTDGGASSVNYDVLRTPIASDFMAAATCVEWDGLDSVAIDNTEPAAGEVFFYLVRSANACPSEATHLGADSTGVRRIGRHCPRERPLGKNVRGQLARQAFDARLQ